MESKIISRIEGTVRVVSAENLQKVHGNEGCSPALVQRWEVSVRPCKIKVILCISRGIACRGHTLGLAVRQGLGRDAL